MEDKVSEISEVISPYSSSNLGRLNINYELVRVESVRYKYEDENDGLELYDQLDEILINKVIGLLKEEAASFNDFSELLVLACPQDEQYKGLMRSYDLTDSLFNSLED